MAASKVTMWKGTTLLYLLSLLPYVLSQTEGDHVYYYDYPESSVSGVEPTFDVPIINVTVVEGQSAVLPCSVDGMTNQRILWLAPNSSPITVENARVYDDTRFNIIQNNNNHKEWNLHIADIKYEDRGTFRCTINTIPVKHKRVILHVQVPPKVVEDSTSKDMVVKEGDHATIVCNITGVPPPTITWFVKYLYTKNPKKMELDAVGKAISITNTSRLLDAEYECVGENGIPPQTTRKIALKIEFKPKVSFTNPRLGQALGKETMLDCVVEANPHATITWFKNGNKVVSSKRTKLDPYEDFAYKMILGLRIDNIQKEDYGIYECEARNRHGSSIGSMELYEYIAKMKAPSPMVSTLNNVTSRRNKTTSQARKNKHRTSNKEQHQANNNPLSNSYYNNNNNLHSNDLGSNNPHGDNHHDNGFYGNHDATNQLPHQQGRSNPSSFYEEEDKSDGILYKLASFYGNSASSVVPNLMKLTSLLSLLHLLLQ